MLPCSEQRRDRVDRVGLEVDERGREDVVGGASIYFGASRHAGRSHAGIFSDFILSFLHTSLLLFEITNEKQNIGSLEFCNPLELKCLCHLVRCLSIEGSLYPFLHGLYNCHSYCTSRQTQGCLQGRGTPALAHIGYSDG